MRIPRIFTPQPIRQGQAVSLDKEPSNHIARVLRMAVGQPLELFNGDGHSYPAQIVAIERSQVTVQVLECIASDSESPLDIHLFQGVSRGDKMELTLQKGVELGVKAFTPLITERCGVKLDQKRWQKKLQHWQKVIESACEQCGRNRIPTLHPVMNFNQALEHISQHAFFLHPQADKQFRQLEPVSSGQQIQLWVGPEGGFSDSEIAAVKTSGCTPLQLGPRVLRTETAALAAVAIINGLWGDY